MRSDTSMIHPRTIVYAVAGWIIFYQSTLMYLWITQPTWDWVLIRFSLSQSDAISFAALYLSLRAYKEAFVLKEEFGSFDGDDIRKKRELEKAGDDLDAIEASPTKARTMHGVHKLRAWYPYMGDDSGNPFIGEDSGNLAANGGEEKEA